MILKSRILEKQGEFTKALLLTDQALKESSEKGTTVFQKLGALISRGYVLANLGRLDELAQVIQEGEESLAMQDKEFDRQEHLAMEHRGSLEYLKARLYFDKGELQSSLDCYQKSLTARKSLRNELAIAETLGGIGWVHIHTSEYRLALENFQKCLVISKKLGNKYEIARSFNSLGLYYANTGDLDSSLKYFEKSLTLSKGLSYDSLMATLYINTSSVYRKREEHERALDCLQEGLAIIEKTGNIVKIAYIHSLISSVYLAKTQFDFSLESAKKSLDSWREIGRKFLKAAELQWIAYIHISKGEYRTALEKSQEALFKSRKIQKNLEQLQELIQKSRNELIEQSTRFAKAMILKKSKRGLMKLQAKQKFQQIVDEEIIGLEIAVLATLNLFELYLLGLKVVDDPRELLLEITKLSNKLYETGKNQESPRVMVMALLIQAKLALIEFRLNEANELLDEAHTLAEKYGLSDLLNKIIAEQKQFKNEFNKWKELIERNASIRDRMDQANLEESLSETIHLETESHFSPFTFSY